MTKNKILLYWMLAIITMSIAGSSLLYAKGLFEKPDPLTVTTESDEEGLKVRASIDEGERQAFLDEMGRVYDFVKQAYYSEIDDEDLYEGAMMGMFGNLSDPYSAFISRKDAKRFSENIEGEFGGLGIYIDEGIDEETDIHYIKVVSPIEGTPAYYAGLRAGDLIIRVDDISTAEMSSNNAVKIMRGEPKTKVALTIKRNGVIFNVPIVRDIIKTIDLKSAMIDDDIAYIRIIRFTQQTPIDFTKAMKGFKSYKTLIVDVRDNPGGALSAVLQLSNLFLDEGQLILGTESRIPSEEKEYNATKDKLVPSDKKLFVMINGGSASASEIFAGAMKDNGRGLLVGTQTFGKGLVQTVRPYKGGLIKLTIAQYYTPAKIYINEIGISPDIELDSKISELSSDELLHAANMQDKDLVQLYVERKKGKIDENSVEEFQKELYEHGIRIENIEFIRRMLFINRNQYLNKIPVYSLEIDSVLSTLLDRIKDGTIDTSSE